MVNDSQLANKLLDRGFIDDSTLKLGREYQRKHDQSLFEALSLGSFVDERLLVETASQILNVPAFALNSRAVPPEVIQLVPSSMAFRNRIFPVEISGDALVLGMVDPLDVLAMDEVSMRTGVDISPVLMTPAEMDRALDKYYGGHDELHALNDGILDSISSLDVDSMVDDVMSDESWVGFFDDSQPSADEMSTRMKDRASTGVLEIDSEEIDVEDDINLLAGLDDPISREIEREQSLANWEVDDAISSNLGGESSFILSKDSAEELFKQETQDLDPIEEDPNDQTRLGIAFNRPATGKSPIVGQTKPGFQISGDTSVGVQRLESVVSEVQEAQEAPTTSELPDIQEGRDRNATPVNTLAVERSDPETRELNRDQIGDLARRFSDGEVSSLEEDTASAEERVERISSLMKGFQRKNETVEAPAVKNDDTKPRELRTISEAVDLHLPEVSDRKLLETLIKILVAQGTLDLNTLITLLKEDS